MSSYLRPRLPNATVFFTVNLAQRGAGLLVDEVGVLRAAVMRTLLAHPFEINAWVVLQGPSKHLN